MSTIKSALEVCAFGIQSCLIAEKVGAVRVELCDNPIEGGTTPSYATIKRVRERVAIQLYPIIRPRSMNYLYDEDEWNIIINDVLMCKELHCDGVSVGVQTVYGEIDADKMKYLVEIAYPMQLTCNRVFDAVPNPYEALETLIDAGCKRILTSGLAATAPEGIEMLKSLVSRANGRISIMPGAGVRSTNVATLKAITGAREFHTSARKFADNLVLFSNPAVSDAGNMYVADEEELMKVMAALQ
ncbi:MAG: copper homeostasis protein CutC [Cytophagales bacterium]|nr:MAG: copper homeostasis protein CutC [Cytophagales bacterium]